MKIDGTHLNNRVELSALIIREMGGTAEERKIKDEIPGQVQTDHGRSIDILLPPKGFNFIELEAVANSLSKYRFLLTSNSQILSVSRKQPNPAR